MLLILLIFCALFCLVFFVFVLCLVPNVASVFGLCILYSFFGTCTCFIQKGGIYFLNETSAFALWFSVPFISTMLQFYWWPPTTLKVVSSVSRPKSSGDDVTDCIVLVGTHCIGVYYSNFRIIGNTVVPAMSTPNTIWKS